MKKPTVRVLVVMGIIGGMGLTSCHTSQPIAIESVARKEEGVQVGEQFVVHEKVVETPADTAPVAKEDIAPVFLASCISEEKKTEMLGYSMPYEGNISFEELAYLSISYYDFDGKTQIGEMVVHREVAADVLAIFQEIYEAKYPIACMELIDKYEANDEKSMAANNTSAFCYRTIAGTSRLSNHSYGVAIDINPVQNPQVIGKNIYPESGLAYVDRTKKQMGMIQKGDVCHEAFIKRGFSWGGEWTNPDYQHFEKKMQ